MEWPDEVTQLLDEVEADPSFSRYQSVGRALERVDLTALDGPDDRRVRVALLSSFTLDPLVAFLRVGCLREGLVPEVRLEGFNQYRQALLDGASDFYAFQPDITFLMVELDSLLPGVGYSRLEEAQVEAALAQLATLAQAYRESASGTLVIGGFVPPSRFPYSLHGGEVEGSYGELNRALEAAYQQDSRILVAPLDRLAAHHGLGRVTNPKLRFVASMAWSETFMPEVGRLALAYVLALKNRIRKCLVLDLDNTLWGGIVGEDGLDGIQLSPEGIGRAYVEFQRAILALHERGTILAINSRNNYDDAMEAIRQHPHMVLAERHFASAQINWSDKASNMRRIAEELNIGLDSLVFLDDSPQERLLVRNQLPEVQTVEMPGDPTLYADVLARLNNLDQLYLTDEDRSRGAMYAAQRSRRELQSGSSDLGAYLDSLEMKLVIRLADTGDLERVHQLIQRTNQFNLTTRRHPRADVEAMATAADWRIYVLRVSDIFGELGLTGVIIARIAGEAWELDTFLMSCRIMGRTIETEFLNQVAGDAREVGARILSGEFIPTPKNKPAARVYADHGFIEVGRGAEGSRWELPLADRDVVSPTRFEVCR